MPVIAGILNNIQSVPKFIKLSPIVDKDYDLEIVPELYLDNYQYSFIDIKQQIQSQLKGMLSFLIINLDFPYKNIEYYKKSTERIIQSKIRFIDMRIEDMFDLECGYLANSFLLEETRKDNYVPLFRPTSVIYNLIAGWIKKTDKIKDKISKALSLMVSTDGEGSHTYSYVAPIEFIPNSNTAILQPKQEMPLSFLLFIAASITNERWRYSYGRKPKGNRLLNLTLKVPINVEDKLDVYAFEKLVEDIPEYLIISNYYKMLY